MRTALPVVFFAFASVAVLAQQPKPPVRVYIWTGKPEVADQAQKLREDSVRDLIAKLDAKWLIVSSQDTSEIQVEISKHEWTSAKSYVVAPRGSPQTTPVLSIYATLRYNDSPTELVCSCCELSPTQSTNRTPTWKDAAAVCAKKTKAWVKENLKQLRPGETPKK